MSRKKIWKIVGIINNNDNQNNNLKIFAEFTTKNLLSLLVIFVRWQWRFGTHISINIRHIAKSGESITSHRYQTNPAHKCITYIQQKPSKQHNFYTHFKHKMPTIIRYSLNSYWHLILKIIPLTTEIFFRFSIISRIALLPFGDGYRSCWKATVWRASFTF